MLAQQVILPEPIVHSEATRQGKTASDKGADSGEDFAQTLASSQRQQGERDNQAKQTDERKESDNVKEANSRRKDSNTNSESQADVKSDVKSDDTDKSVVGTVVDDDTELSEADSMEKLVNLTTNDITVNWLDQFLATRNEQHNQANENAKFHRDDEVTFTKTNSAVLQALFGDKLAEDTELQTDIVETSDIAPVLSNNGKSSRLELDVEQTHDESVDVANASDEDIIGVEGQSIVPHSDEQNSDLTVESEQTASLVVAGTVSSESKTVDASELQQGDDDSTSVTQSVASVVGSEAVKAVEQDSKSAQINTATSSLPAQTLAMAKPETLGAEQQKRSSDTEQLPASQVQSEQITNTAQTPDEVVRVQNQAMQPVTADIGKTVESGQVDRQNQQLELGQINVERQVLHSRHEQAMQTRHDAVLKEQVLNNRQELAGFVQQQVGLMMAKNMKSVDIRMDPPELGSMQVRLSIQNDQAQVSFVVSSQQTKDALEQSMPKLRELLEQQGMNLTESDVNQQQSGQAEQGTDGNGEHGANGQVASEGSTDDGQVARTVKVDSPYQVDYYA